MTARALRPLALAATALAATALAAACSGYADLPLPSRDVGRLEIESARLFSGATGRAQVSLTLPDDAEGPVVLVGHPRSATPEATVRAWAWGPCPDGPAPTGDAPRLCLAVATEAVVPLPTSLAISLVAETRGDGRRFSLFGEGALP